MGEWISRIFSDSASQTGKEKGEDTSNETRSRKAPLRSFQMDRAESTSRGEDEFEDILDRGFTASRLLSALVGSDDIRSITDILSRELPAIVPFDIGTLRWSDPESRLDDPLFQVEEDFPQSVDFIAMGSILEGTMEVQVHSPDRTDNRGGWSGKMDGVCRARTTTGEPLFIRMHSGLVVPLYSREETVGMIILFSTREGVMEGVAEETSLKMVWDGIGSALRRVLGSIDARDELQRTRELLNSSDELFVLWREAGPLWEIDCNPTAESFIRRDGMTPEMMEGPFFAPPGKVWDLAMSAWRSAFEEEETNVVELELQSLEGDRVGYLCIFSPYEREKEVVGVRMTGVRSSSLMRFLSGPRLEEGGSLLCRMDLCSLVKEEIGSIIEKGAGTEVKMEPPVGPLEISGHPLLRSAFRSLLERAMELSPPGHPVSIGISTSIQGINISIKNDRYPLLEGFTATEFGDGTGTPDKLQYARGIIELHGGSLHEGSENADGSMFRVMLPWSVH
ncbi:MAG: HAMP domain-containing histidine kinase [Candidatus Thermoplasmatota archaeon]|nr:HAMP domain-containing histidine kinase [Candidatus Thermoplasmatota archaeon]